MVQLHKFYAVLVGRFHAGQLSRFRNFQGARLFRREWQSANCVGILWNDGRADHGQYWSVFGIVNPFVGCLYVPGSLGIGVHSPRKTLRNTNPFSLVNFIYSM